VHGKLAVVRVRHMCKHVQACVQQKHNAWTHASQPHVILPPPTVPGATAMKPWAQQQASEQGMSAAGNQHTALRLNTAWH